MMQSIDYHGIFSGLNRADVDYMVIGGLAVNFHGIPRMTYDVDIMIRLDRDNLKRLLEKLNGWGFKIKQPINPFDLLIEQVRLNFIKEKNLKAITFHHPSNPIAEIDVLIDSPVPYQNLKDHALYFELNDEKVPVVSVRDLIEMKLNTERAQDIADVRHLRSILKDGEKD